MKINKNYIMKIISEITFTYQDETAAKIVFDSLEKDNEGFLKSKLDKNSIIYEIESDKLGSFLSTADDLISSEIVVEKIINIKQ